MPPHAPRLAVAAAAVLAAVAVPAPATAALTWDPSSLIDLYTPTGPPGEDGQERYYAYAPSVIASEEATRVWTCHNNASGVVEDDVFATTIVEGEVVRDESALTKSDSGWDSFHICDPSVVRVDAVLDGTEYRYAMFYLGNDVDASAHNQVGVAYAEDLDGPWVKHPDPLVEFTGDDDSQWGAGQPSATTIDPDAGTAMLFWTEGYGPTTTYRATVDLDGPDGPVLGAKLEVATAGLTGSDGGEDWLNNADFAYDPGRDRFFAVREQHPYPADDPDYIGASLQVVSIDAASIWDGGGSWTAEGVIDPELTGFGRNHNAGLVRTEYGTLPEPDSLEVVFTGACGDCADSLWQYRLHQVTGAIG